MKDYPDSICAMNLSWRDILCMTAFADKPDYSEVLTFVDAYINHYSKLDEQLQDMHDYRNEILEYIKDPSKTKPDLIL